MSKKIRFAALLMAVIMLLGVFTACSGSSTKKDKDKRDRDDDEVTERRSRNDDDDDDDPDVTNVSTSGTPSMSGRWVLVDRRIQKGEPNNTVPDYVTNYAANEYVHEYTDYLPGNGYHDPQSVEFTATCTEVPGEIRPGDRVVFSVGLSMEDQADYLFTASAAVYFSGSYDGTSEVPYSSGIRFDPTNDDAPDMCELDTCGNVDIRSIEVYRDIAAGTEEGEMMAISFCACQSSTVWVYKWYE